MRAFGTETVEQPTSANATKLIRVFGIIAHRVLVFSLIARFILDYTLMTKRAISVVKLGGASADARRVESLSSGHCPSP